MIEYIQKNWLGIIVVLLAFAGVYWYGQTEGRKGQGGDIPKPDEADRQLTEDEKKLVVKFSKAIFEDIGGYNLTMDEMLWRDFMAQDDRIFVGTWNIFLDTYDKTIARILEKDWFIPGSFYDAIRQNFMARAKRLGLIN